MKWRLYEKIKKIIIGIGIIVLLGCIFFTVHYVRINASIDSLAGKEWKTVTMYYDGTEMDLTAEEIEQLHGIFDEVRLTIDLFTRPKDFKTYGVIDFRPFYVNGREFQVILSGRMGFDGLPYFVVSGQDYADAYVDLRSQFAESRGLR